MKSRLIYPIITLTIGVLSAYFAAYITNFYESEWWYGVTMCFSCLTAIIAICGTMALVAWYFTDKNNINS